MRQGRLQRLKFADGQSDVPRDLPDSRSIPFAKRERFRPHQQEEEATRLVPLRSAAAPMIRELLATPLISVL
jgi:hypothetical protein